MSEPRYTAKKSKFGKSKQKQAVKKSSASETSTKPASKSFSRKLVTRLNALLRDDDEETVSTTSTSRAVVNQTFSKNQLRVDKLEEIRRSDHKDIHIMELEERLEKQMRQFMHRIQEQQQQHDQRIQEQQQQHDQRIQEQQQQHDQRIQEQQQQLDQRIQEQQQRLEQRLRRRFERDANTVQNSLTLRACISEFDTRLARHMLQANQQYWNNIKYIDNHPVTVNWEIPASAMALITTIIENPTRRCYVLGVSDMVNFMREFLTMQDWMASADDKEMIKEVKDFLSNKEIGNTIAHVKATKHAVELEIGNNLLIVLTESFGLNTNKANVLRKMVLEMDRFDEFKEEIMKEEKM